MFLVEKLSWIFAAQLIFGDFIKSVLNMSGVYTERLTMEVLEGFGDLKMEEQVVRTVKYADDLVLLATEKAVPQGMIDKQTEII